MNITGTTKFVIEVDARVFAKAMRYIDHSGRTLEEILVNFIWYLVDDESRCPNWDEIITELRCEKYADFGIDISAYQGLRSEDIVISEDLVGLLKKVARKHEWSVAESIKIYQNFVTEDYIECLGYRPPEIEAIMNKKKLSVFRNVEQNGSKVKFSFIIDKGIVEKARQFITPLNTVLEDLVTRYVKVISTHYLESFDNAKEYKNTRGEWIWKDNIRREVEEALELELDKAC